MRKKLILLILPIMKDKINLRLAANGDFNWINHYIIEYENTLIGFCQYYDCSKTPPGFEWDNGPKVINMEKRNVYLRCALDTYMKPEQMRIEMIRRQLNNEEDSPTAVLMEMDAVIREFEKEVHLLYHKWIEQQGGVTSKAYENYKDSLYHSISKTYPWLDETMYKQLYGQLSYR